MVTNLDQLFDKKILITGASGFIGSQLCAHLANNVGEIHAISRVRHIPEEKGIRWWQGDLADLQKVRYLMRRIKPNVIFHLASYVSGSRELENVIPTFRNNLMSQINILVTAKEVGCDRVLFAGSMEEPASNDPEIFPSSPYAAAKWAGSTYARMFHALYDLPVVNLRVFMVYGPGQRDLKKLIPYVITSLLRGETPILSSGKREIDWIYVKDVVEGMLSVAQAPDVEGCTVDLGSGKLVPIRNIVDSVIKITNSSVRPQFGGLQDRPFEKIRVANIEKTFEKTGWKPKTSLEEGLMQTVAWYKNNSK